MAAEYRQITISYKSKNFSITGMRRIMEIVIESTKQTLDRSSARSSKYNRKRAKFNYCLN